MAKEKKKGEIEIINRKAGHEFHFLLQIEAGIMLVGTEVKSIRLGNANLRDAFCLFKNGELFVKNMFIAEYKFGNQFNHETRRTRKLLLKKQELKKLERKVKEKGLTIIPYRMFMSERGLIKLEVVLVKGKKTYDKRQSIKERENKRSLDRMKKMDI